MLPPNDGMPDVEQPATIAPAQSVAAKRIAPRNRSFGPAIRIMSFSFGKGPLFRRL
jgi:hypothetical protein